MPRANGKSEQRLYGLVAWREAPYYTERERPALAWTEALTLIADNHVPDEVYDQARKQFNEQELADLTLAVACDQPLEPHCDQFSPKARNIPTHLT